MVVLVAMKFTSLAANGPLPTDHIPANQVIFSVVAIIACQALNNLLSVIHRQSDLPFRD